MALAGLLAFVSLAEVSRQIVLTSVLPSKGRAHTNAKPHNDNVLRTCVRSSQVKELYGPLLACVTASKSAFDAMVRQHSDSGTPQEFIAAARENPESKDAHTGELQDIWLVWPQIH